ncbi:hypothetical protein DYBT9275_05357 [Dyadobacter sp. CECT 9275]|uniref:Chlorite dismutase n=1 Tax=Dyadobacter helix TaxID=2822344 RepID=A0A916N8C5_9BACT|nr:chlorite dismutase family protein [Dyadobacter sp. CECT 9275]CAG5015564.1 hypothetical protein DYBT9275_05357 [Dyadobacter sp. CECT 9275]
MDNSRRKFITSVAVSAAALSLPGMATADSLQSANQLKNTFDFVAGETGTWKITKISPFIGEAMALAPFLNIVPTTDFNTISGKWTLRGQTSNLRYTTQEEKAAMDAVQAGLGRPEATMAALIPIKKSDEWWMLAQDQRRAIFADKSDHTKVGMHYLPGVARKLYHSRDIGEPFDFLTWFEYAPQHSDEFEELVGKLRKTEEWKYVTREFDIRLVRA